MFSDSFNKKGIKEKFPVTCFTISDLKKSKLLFIERKWKILPTNHKCETMTKSLKFKEQKQNKTVA